MPGQQNSLPTPVQMVAGPANGVIRLDNAADNNVDEDEEEEYVVETIRAKRKNARTGGYEYQIKWENFPDSDNTWEPCEHLKCPEIVQRFEEAEKEKRRQKKAKKLQALANSKNNTSDNNAAQDGDSDKRTRLNTHQKPSSSAHDCNGDVFMEYDDHGEEEQDDPSKSNRQQVKDSHAEQLRFKGFERRLPLDSILACTQDDVGKLWFLVKWTGRSEIELISNDDMEAGAPKELCKWYRERLYWTISDPYEQEPHIRQAQMLEAKRQCTSTSWKKS